MKPIAASATGAPWMPATLLMSTSRPIEGESATRSTPVPSTCTHLRFLRLLEHLVAHHRAERHEDVGAGDVGIDLVAVIDRVYFNIGKMRGERLAIAGDDIVRHRQHDQQARHRPRIRSAFWWKIFSMTASA